MTLTPPLVTMYCSTNTFTPALPGGGPFMSLSSSERATYNRKSCAVTSKNGLVNWAHMLGPNNCRALLREGINCQMFKELADLSWRDSQIPLQHCILRKPDWVLLSNVATGVVTAEAAILILVINCLLVLSPAPSTAFPSLSLRPQNLQKLYTAASTMPSILCEFMRNPNSPATFACHWYKRFFGGMMHAIRKVLSSCVTWTNDVKWLDLRRFLDMRTLLFQ